MTDTLDVRSSRQLPPVSIGLTGGGTAGHVWPHFALFEDQSSLLSQAWNSGRIQVVYFGSSFGMEKDLVESAMQGKWDYVSLSNGRLRRYFDWRNFTDPLRVVVGFFQAALALRKKKVRFVFSKGGYVAAPVVWAAWVLRIPVIIHESDVSPALATKLGFPFCIRLVTAFSETQNYFPSFMRRKIVNLGLPLRVSLFSASKETARQHFDIGTEKPVLLVFGGSLGAEVLNRACKEALTDLVSRYEVIHIVGKGKSFAPATFINAPESMKDQILRSYHQFEFLGSDMKLAYAAADFAFCRAGASSIFELAAARIPMILVPLDLNQSRGDQIVNAEVFERAGWAKVLRESALNQASFLDACREIEEHAPEFRARLGSAPGPDAAAKVAGLIWSHLQINISAESEKEVEVVRAQ